MTAIAFSPSRMASACASERARLVGRVHRHRRRQFRSSLPQELDRARNSKEADHPHDHLPGSAFEFESKPLKLDRTISLAEKHYNCERDGGGARQANNRRKGGAAGADRRRRRDHARHRPHDGAAGNRPPGDFRRVPVPCGGALASGEAVAGSRASWPGLARPAVLARTRRPREVGPTLKLLRLRFDPPRPTTWPASASLTCRSAGSPKRAPRLSPPGQDLAHGGGALRNKSGNNKSGNSGS